jgi:hypothetical protein
VEASLTHRFEILPASRAHAEEIAPHLRFLDAEGLRERYGITRLGAALGALELSSHAWAVLVDGEAAPLALFGVVPEAPSIIGSAGRPATPWVLLNGAVERRKVTAWKASLVALPLLLQHAPWLQGVCDASFKRSIAWLRRLGFSIAGSRLSPAPGLCFVTFERKG